MSSPGSVSRWIAALKEGDPAAAQPLWKRYYRQLVALARKMLRPSGRRAVDEEEFVIRLLKEKKVYTYPGSQRLLEGLNEAAEKLNQCFRIGSL